MLVTVFTILLLWGVSAVLKKEKFWGPLAWCCFFLAGAGLWLFQEPSGIGHALVGAAYAAYVLCGIFREIIQNRSRALIPERGVAPRRSPLWDMLVDPDKKQK